MIGRADLDDRVRRWGLRDDVVEDVAGGNAGVGEVRDLVAESSHLVLLHLCGWNI